MIDILKISVIFLSFFTPIGFSLLIFRKPLSRSADWVVFKKKQNLLSIIVYWSVSVTVALIVLIIANVLLYYTVSAFYPNFRWMEIVR